MAVGHESSYVCTVEYPCYAYFHGLRVSFYCRYQFVRISE